MSHKIYEQTSRRVQRSELAVPGSNPKMFEKALNSDVDFVFLDLETASQSIMSSVSSYFSYAITNLQSFFPIKR